MKEFFNEYGWLVVYGVIIAAVISSLVPDFTNAVSTAIIQVITSTAEYLNDLIAAL